MTLFLGKIYTGQTNHPITIFYAKVYKSQTRPRSALNTPTFSQRRKQTMKTIFFLPTSSGLEALWAWKPGGPLSYPGSVVFTEIVTFFVIYLNYFKIPFLPNRLPQKLFLHEKMQFLDVYLRYKSQAQPC